MKTLIATFFFVSITILFFSFSELNKIKPLIKNKEIQFKKITLKEAKINAKKEKKLIMLYFHAVWCGPCKGMSATTFKEKKVADFYNKNFVNVKMDVDDEEVKQIAAEFQINSVPFYIFLDQNGKLLEYNRGFIESIDFFKIGEEALKENEFNKAKSLSKNKVKIKSI